MPSVSSLAPLFSRLWPFPDSVTAPEQRLRVLLGVIVVAAMAIGFAVGGASFLNDPDTLWHISVGKDIWLTKAFPHVDAYSHSFNGEPWIAKEWLSQLVLYGAYLSGGWNGVALTAIAVMLLVTWQLYWPLSAQLKPVFAAAITVGSLSLCADVFIARPHIMVLPVIIFFVAKIMGYGSGQTCPVILDAWRPLFVVEYACKRNLWFCRRVLCFPDVPSRDA